MTKANLKYNPAYQEYEQVLHWIKTNEAGEGMPEKYAEWLRIWRIADNLIAKGTMRLETVAKMLMQEFPGLTLSTAWRHVTNAMNYYNSVSNISKDTRRRYVTRGIEKVIAILYEQLPLNPKLAREITMLYREMAEIEGLKDHSVTVDPDLFKKHVIVFSSDPEVVGMKRTTEKQLNDLFSSFIQRNIINEEEREVLLAEQSFIEDVEIIEEEND